LTWLNLVCLDAPTVAIVWLLLFARTFGVAASIWNCVALFLTAWLIYLADRFGDSLALTPEMPISLRQRFCIRHRGFWLIAIAAIGIADALVVSTHLDLRTLKTGAEIGAVAIVYLILNHRWSHSWQIAPLKEAVIGLLFAVGTIASVSPRLPALDTRFLVPSLFFAVLCTLNCISIAVWERPLDAAQRRGSISTAFPGTARFVLPALVVLAAMALAIFGLHAFRLYVCVAMSALLLAGLHIFRCHLQPDVCTALADIVLLSPIVVLLT
jgi:hypothetical protein